MLKKRVYTAVFLAAVLFLILWSRNEWLFKRLLLVLFCAASWENARLFGNRYPVAMAVVSGLVIAGLSLWLTEQICIWFAMVSVVIWILCLIPSLFRELPERGSISGRLYQFLYWFSILGSFLSVYVLYNQSALLLLSVLMIVWLADIGAYFAGRAFGKHKLAPFISPGKTWEGVIGGVAAVLLVAFCVICFSPWQTTLAAKILEKYGWVAMICGLVALVALSILGDLLESKLKRRAGIKDSSQLLPGHGGVLDRIDSLIPVLPLALLLGIWL